jgi:hypothetical protein
MDDAGTPKVLQSYATGTVTVDPSSNSCAGGLVGAKTIGDISNSYASGAITANCAGGFVGQNYAGPYQSISSSYATGAVNGTEWAGGLIGSDGFGSKVKHTFWDMTTSGITDPSQGAGNIANDPGIKGLSDKKLKSGLPAASTRKSGTKIPPSTTACPTRSTIRRQSDGDSRSGSRSQASSHLYPVRCTHFWSLKTVPQPDPGSSLQFA